MFSFIAGTNIQPYFDYANFFKFIFNLFLLCLILLGLQDKKSPTNQ